MPVDKDKNIPAWSSKISNAHQVGGIELSVLTDGPGAGARIAWINTGAGLRYKVVLDRAMDIADAFFDRHSLSWLSYGGVTSPQPFSSKGADWLRTFAGGLVTTCGLSHVGGPEADEYGERGLHGPISNTPASLESVIQPDPQRGRMQMSITGIIRQTQVFGPSLELRRTISGVLGQAFLTIRDEVTNMGNLPAPHMLLYHINLGWPLVDEGCDLLWNGNVQLINEKRDRPIFNDKHPYHKAQAPMDTHRGSGESTAYADIEANDNGECICGVNNAALGLALSLRFQKNQLPWFTNWQHWAPGEYVTGMEPGTHPPIGQAKARRENTLIFLAPLETKCYDLRLDLYEKEKDIKTFLSNFNSVKST